MRKGAAMASVIPHGDTFRIGFTGLDRKRRTIYCGAISEHNAHGLRRLVERILEAAALGESLDLNTASRIAALPDTTYEKLVGVRLVNPREKRGAGDRGGVCRTVRRTANGPPPRQLIVLRHVVRNLSDFFGDTAMVDVTRGDGDDFARWLLKDGRSASQVENKGTSLGGATCGKRIQHASTIFNDAVRRGVIPSNPLSDVRRPAATNDERKVYVPAATVETLIERNAIRNGGCCWHWPVISG